MTEESTSDFFTIDTAGIDLDAFEDEADKEDCFKKKNESTKKKIDFSRVRENDVNMILLKASLTPDFDKRAVVDAMAKSGRKQKMERRLAREKTAGKNWHDMPKAEITEEKQRDLELLQMRGALDPKSHYRRKDRNVLPKYFEVGKIVDDPANFYSSRMTRKERKNTMVEELMQDVELVAKAKHRYSEILQRKGAVRRGAFRQNDFLSKRSKYKSKKRSH